MKPQQIRALARLMQDHDIEVLKVGDVELRRSGPRLPVFSRPAPADLPKPPRPTVTEEDLVAMWQAGVPLRS